MGRASDLFYNSMAIDDRAEAKTLMFREIAPSTTNYTDSFIDMLTTPLYSYQSIPITTNAGTVLKYLQYIRPEVLANGHVLTAFSALDNNEFLWSWGKNNTNGEWGNNTTGGTASVPVSVIGNRKFNQIIMTQSGVAALDYSGYAWTWGYNGNGRLGDNTGSDRSSPVSVVGNRQFVTVGASYAGFIALDMSGFAWSWGANGSGDLGDNTTTHKSSPVSVVGGTNFVAISGNSGIDTYNDCWSWGNNVYGALGDGSTTNRSSPVAMSGIRNIVQIGCNTTYNNLMLNFDGYCYAVGYNASGELGDGTTINRSSPVSVIGGRKFSQIAIGFAGGGSVCFGLEDTGLLWAWGDNSTGAFGDGTVIKRSSPVSIRQGTRKFIQIAVNTDSVAATDMDGNIWTWGVNSWGVGGGAVPNSNPLLLPGDFYGQVK